MPIDVFQIENLFWSNESYEFPNALPTSFLDQKELPLAPRMSGYYSGTIRLVGGHGNGCKYKGIYFHLKKVRLLNADDDEKKEVGQYALVRDMGANTVLTRDVEVKGDLATWNLDPLLTDHLNRSFWMLEKPIEIYRTPFLAEEITDGDSVLKENPDGIKKITGKPVQKVLSRKFFELLKIKIKDLDGFRLANEKKMYNRRKDIYIFGLFEPSNLIEGGKGKLVERINKALDELPTDKTRQLVSVSVPNHETPGNTFFGHYAISYKTNAIGSANNSMVLRTLDLSGLTDIVPIAGKDGKQKSKLIPLNEETGIFEIPEQYQSFSIGDQPGKLSRKFYAPLGDPKNGSHYFSGLYRGKPAPRLMKGWKDSIMGQKIKLKDPSQPNRTTFAGFYGLDRVDFSLSWYTNGGSGIYTANILSSGYTAPGEQDHLLGSKRQRIPIRQYLQRYFDVNTVGKDSFRPRVIPGVHQDYTADQKADRGYQVGRTMKKPPVYGVLLGQTERDWNSGRRCEYTGGTPLNLLNGYSGINLDGLKKQYEVKDKGGSTIDSYQLSNLCGQTHVSKFFLDLDLLLGMYFSPKVCDYDGSNSYQHNYLCEDNFELNRFLQGGWQTYANPIAAGIKRVWNPETQQALANPFTDSSYPAYTVERGEKINKVLLKSSLSLPEPIKKGDYFISSLEYEGTPWDKRIGPTEENQYRGFDEGQVMTLNNVLEDFLIPPAEDLIEREDLEKHEQLRDGKALCICSNYEGGIEIRPISFFKYTHRLSNVGVQAVEEVDGEKEKTITYGHLKNTGIKIDTKQDIPEAQQINLILAQLYQSMGYEIDFGGANPLGNQLTTQDLEADEGNLFDLVGTDGLVFVRGKDQVHFICKEKDPSKKGILTPRTLKRNQIDRSRIPEGLKNASLTAKINQINILYFKNVPFPIKTKFLFTEKGVDTPFYVNVEGISTESKPVNRDYYFFKAKGEGDEIDQIVDVAKDPIEIQGIANQLQLEQLKLEQNFETERYNLKQQYLGLDQKLIDIHAERASFDLNIEDERRFNNMLIDAAGMITGAATGVAGLLPNVKSLMKAIPGSEPGSKHVDYKHTPASMFTKGYKFSSKVVQGLGFKGGNQFSGLHGIVDYATTGQKVKVERSRRIQEDKDMSSRTLALNTLGIDTAHFQAMRDKALQINALSHSIFKEGFNEESLGKKWREEKFAGDKQKDKIDIYLLTMIPNEKQLQYIEEYRQHFGVQCDIPSQSVSLGSGMKPNVIRFRNLDDGSIVGIPSIIDRTWLKMKLLAQVKIIGLETRKRKYIYSDYEHVRPVIVKDAEDVAKIEGLTEALAKSKEGEALLEVKIKELEAEKDSIEDERDKCREEITKAHNKERELLNRAEQAEKSVAELQKKIADCEQEKETLDGLEEELEQEQAKSEDLKQKLINLNSINNTWVKFARELGYTTAPVASSNFDYTEDQKKEITKNTEKIVKEFEELKKRPSESTLKCDENATCWTFKDLIKFLHDMKYDFLKIYESITKLPFYGFTPYEFGDAKDMDYLQFVHQTVDELEALEKDDISFLPKENEQLKIQLLTDEGQKIVRSYKWSFVHSWISSFAKARKLESDIRKEPQIKGVGLLGNLYGGTYDVPFVTETTEDKNDPNVKTERGCDGYSLKKPGNKGTAIGEDFDGEIFSLRGHKNLFMHRYTDSSYPNWNDGNHIYYSFAYYDLNQQGPTGTPSQFYGCAIKHILENVKRYTGLNETYLGANIFAVKPKNGTINVWKYTGFSDKLYRPLYPLFLFRILTEKSLKDRITEGKVCCESVSLGNLRNITEFKKGFKRIKIEHILATKFVGEIYYKVLGENEEAEVAEEEMVSQINEEWEKMFQSNSPQYDSL